VLLRFFNFFIVLRFNIKVSSIIGAIVGLLNMVFITSRYFPVYIATVLKLRSGLFKSLDNEEFERYRSGIDNTWLILGFSFWGPIISSFMVSFIVMAVVYCFMDPVRQVKSSAPCFSLNYCFCIKFVFLFNNLSPAKPVTHLSFP